MNHGLLQGSGLAFPRGANTGELTPGVRAGGAGMLGPWKRVWSSDMPEQETSQAQSSGQATWVYMGQVVEPFVAKYIEYRCTTAGTGAQTAEAGWFYSHEPPKPWTQYPPALYPWEVSGSLTSMLGTGRVRNLTPFTKSFPRGLHVWSGWRVAMATAQPAMRVTLSDWLDGRVGYRSGSAALTAQGAFLPSGALAVTITVAAPRMTLD